jgi:hypothetical protein
MYFIKNNIIPLIILIVLLLVLLRTCRQTPAATSSTVIVKDTVWIHTDSTVYNEPQILETIPYPVDRITKEYLPDTNYDALVKKYIGLVDKYLATNISLDSIRIDSIGYVRIVDSISKNMIVGRSVNYKLKYPTIKEIVTKTITVPEEKRRQVYVGGGVFVDPVADNVLFKNVNAGFLYKTKKDQILGAGVQWDGKTVNYGLSTYLKLSFRKNNN